MLIVRSKISEKISRSIDVELTAERDFDKSDFSSNLL